MKHLMALKHGLYFTYKSSNWLSAIYFILLVGAGFIQAYSVEYTKLIIESAQSNPQALLKLIIIWGVLTVTPSALESIIQAISGSLKEKMTATINMRILDKFSSIADLSTIENQSTIQMIDVLQRKASYSPVNFLACFTFILRYLATICTLTILLADIVWWIPLIIIVCFVPQSILSVVLVKKQVQVLFGTSNESLMMKYINSLSFLKDYQKEIRVYNLGKYLKDIYLDNFKNLHNRMEKYRIKFALIPVPLSFLSILGVLLSVYYVGQGVQSGQNTAGEFAMVFQSLIIFTTALSSFINYSASIADSLDFFDKLNHFENTPDGLVNLEPSRKLDSVKCLEFKNVSFTYPNGKTALKNVSFKVNVGKRIGVVGENGAGKSTLLSLICRFYEPSDGKILINDIDIRYFSAEDLRQQIGFVVQDFAKYELTIKENIMIGATDNKDINEENINHYLKAANFPLDNFKNGMFTQLGKQFGGTELSGGQWQKLAVVRAAIRNSPILLMDEPSSALDPRSEREILNEVLNLSKDKVCIVVTHRLGSVRSLDNLLVLKDGVIVEEGSFNNLEKNGGEFSQLWSIQKDQYL